MCIFHILLVDSLTMFFIGVKMLSHSILVRIFIFKLLGSQVVPRFCTFLAQFYTGPLSTLEGV
jgi:hypothetical protein